MIELAPWSELSPEDKAAVRSLSVEPRQVEYAGTVESSIAQCEASPAGEAVGLAVLANKAAIGFLLLKRDASAPSWAAPEAAVVSALRIDLAYQGKGFGTRALAALPPWVEQHWPSVRSIALSVDEENGAAIRSYLKAGWADQGVRVQGRIGWVRYMSLELPAGQCPNPSIEGTSNSKLRLPLAAPHVKR